MGFLKRRMRRVDKYSSARVKVESGRSFTLCADYDPMILANSPRSLSRSSSKSKEGKGSWKGVIVMVYGCCQILDFDNSPD